MCFKIDYVKMEERKKKERLFRLNLLKVLPCECFFSSELPEPPLFIVQLHIASQTNIHFSASRHTQDKPAETVQMIETVKYCLITFFYPANLES
mgnify:CR=1 FL=1